MIRVSSITNRFLNKESNIQRFFISIIGQYTRNPSIEQNEKRFKKLLAIKASEVEHAENIKANNIIKRSELAAVPLVILKNSCETTERMSAVIKAPIIKKEPAVKNSEAACINKI